MKGIINTYTASFNPSNNNSRKVLPTDNNLTKSCNNEKSVSSVKSEINFNNNKKLDNIHPSNTNYIVELIAII